MKSYLEATKRPHGYLMLDLKPTTDDQRRLESNVLHEENIADQQNLDLYTRKHSCQQPPIADDQHRLISNVLPKESTIGQQNLARYSRKRVLKEANYTSTAPDTHGQKSGTFSGRGCWLRSYSIAKNSIKKFLI